MDPIFGLARAAAETPSRKIPSDVLEFTKLTVLDTLGVLVAGRDEPGCPIAVGIVRRWGGARESTILRHGDKVPAPNAAFANSVMARALDYDTAARPGLHLSASTVIAALAVGEVTGASGIDALASIAVGDDLALRLNRTTNGGVTYNGYEPTGVSGVFAVAAVAGRLMDLDAEAMRNALGIAFVRSGGSFQSNADGALSVRFNQGFTSYHGVLSAELASMGVTGPTNVLGGRFGYYALFSGGMADERGLLEGLGREFLGPRYIMVKRWPTCGLTLSPVDCLVRLLEESRISPGDVEGITAFIGPYAYGVVGRPFEPGRIPQVSAQFNLQYALANVIVRGSPALEHYDEGAVLHEGALRFLPRVRVAEDRSIDTEFRSRLSITLRGGAREEFECGPPRGHPDNPISRDELIRKFLDAVRRSSRPLDDSTAREIIDRVLSMESMSTVRELVELLA
ncbi:MAG: MmgE/PrpD family protein [Conexivisphaera sp.]